MKKLFLALSGAVLLACSVNPAFAYGRDASYYVSGEFGSGRLQLKEKVDGTSYKEKEKITNARVAYGYDFMDGRWQIDYTHTSPAEFNESTESMELNTRIKTKSIGVTGIVSPFQGDIKPYAGVRFAWNRITAHTKFSQDGIAEAETKVTKPKFGIGAVAGVEYKVARRIYLNVGGYYDHLGNVDGIRAANYGVMGGIRVGFK